MAHQDPGSSPPGFFTQLRRQHPVVKAILVLVVVVLFSPFVVGILWAIGRAGGGPLIFAFLGGSAWFAGWFVFTTPRESGPTIPRESVAPILVPVSCESCGFQSISEQHTCPSCGSRLHPDPEDRSLAEIARFLNRARREYLAGRLDAASLARIQAYYEPQLERQRLHAEAARHPHPAAHPAAPPLPAAMPPAASTVPLPPAVGAPHEEAAPAEGILPPAAVTPPPPVLEAPPPPAPEPVMAAAAEEAPPPPPPPPSEPSLPQVPPRPPHVRKPRRTAREVGQVALGWAAERQADILLYVGAFLLSVAAIIFVAYQGEAVSGELRVLILSVYAIGFLVLGLVLHRWERVKEAGPVFVALGAILVPLDFVALRTQVITEEQLPSDVLWFLASSTCSVLYFALAARGYGRLYALPGIPSALIAWASLGSILGLPDAWFGPWFAAVAAPLYVAAIARFRRDLLSLGALGLALFLGIGAIVWTQVVTAITGDDRVALPAVYAIATLAVAAGLRWRRDALALAALPALAGLSAASAVWSTAGLPLEWRSPFIAASAAGYLVVAHFQPDSRARGWASVAALGLLAALVHAHTTVLQEASDRGALPATYAIAFIAASGAYGRWRWAAAAAAMPPLAAATLLTTWWAAGGEGLEWYGAFIGVATLGYLALAAFDSPRRTGAWQTSSALCALLGLAVAHVAVAATGDPDRWALPAAYGPVLGGAVAAFARWRWQWRLAPGAIPALAALAGISIGWAGWDLQPEWFPAFAAAAALGYLPLAHFDEAPRARFWGALSLATGAIALVSAHAYAVIPESHDAALPLTYAIALAAAVAAYLRWRWLEPGVLIPPLAAMAALTTLRWTSDLQIEWYGAFAALAGLGYVALSKVDPPERRQAWRVGHNSAELIAVALTQAVLIVDREAGPWALPVAYGLVAVGRTSGFLLWRWIEAGLGIPPALAMTGLTATWAAIGLDPVWYGVYAAAAAPGYVLLGRYDALRFPGRIGVWRAGHALAAVLAVLLAQSVILSDPAAEQIALPITYAVVFASAALAFWFWRWVEAGAALPPLAAMTALTATWATSGLDVEWYGAFAAAAGPGYLLLARFDYPRRLKAWQYASIVPAALALVLAHTSASAIEDVQRLALPVTYAVLLVGTAAAFLQWRFTWRVAPAALPLLLSMFALTGSWALWDLQVEWYGAFIAAAALGYVAVAAADDRRLILSWLRFGALVAACGLVLAHGSQAEAGALRGGLPTAYGFTLAACAVAVARWRLEFRDGIAALPLLGAAFGASLLWAAVHMPLEWLAAWLALASAGYAPPIILDERYRGAWRTAAIVAGALALAVAHLLALDPDLVRWQLPAAYGALLLGWTVQAVRLRDASLLAPPILTAVGGATVLWAAGAGQPWWPYPALAVSATLVATQRWWRRDRVLGAAGWFYVVTIGPVAALATLPADMSHPAHGIAVQVGSGVLLVAASLWAQSSIIALFARPLTSLLRAAERTVLAQGAFAFFFGASASLNALAGIEGADRAWPLAAVALAAWALTVLRVRGYEGLWTFVPVGIAGMTVAGMVAAESDPTITGVLALATAGAVAAFASTRRWFLLGIANSTLFLAVWTAWRWQGLDLPYLPMAFAALALLEWAALTGLRRYTARPGESDYVITYISWGPWLLSALVSGLLLSQKGSRLDASESLVSTVEWGLSAAVLGLAAAAVMAEGLRIGRRSVWVVASAALLGSFLMAVATREPTNVQAYTAPTGLWLIGVALTFRRSPDLFRQQLFLHEAVIILGALYLVLPPAEQSFEPGGGKFGLELIGIGVGMLLVGLLLHARWLVAAAILTLTATSVRMVTGGLFSAPYWLLLGIAGTLLLVFGFLILLERERWDRFRVAVVAWWEEAQKPLPPDYPGARPVP